MKGKVLMAVSVLAGCLLWTTVSKADSLIIQFSSGKTQQVTLEEPVNAVVNIQSQTTGTESHEATEYVRSRELYNKEINRKASDALVGKKKSYSLKWGTPIVGE
jgi:hypothetical protein